MPSLKDHAVSLSLLDDSRWQTIGRAIAATTGEIWECGAYKGGTTLWMKEEIGVSTRVIRAFDTFGGMPFAGEHDHHPVGSFAQDDTSFTTLQSILEGHSGVHLYRGAMPATFSGLENSVIGVAHIDVDNEGAVRDCLAFIWPRLQSGGYVVVDDYGCHDCPGAKLATDEFITPLSLPLLRGDGDRNPQAYFIKP